MRTILKISRPVSNLNFISKVLEKFVLCQLSKHLRIKILEIAFQPAYLLDSFDKNKVCLLTLLDLSAVFYTTDHEILARRLEETYGLSGPVLEWFESYLCSRSQSIKIGKSNSEFMSIQFGLS